MKIKKLTILILFITFMSTLNVIAKTVETNLFFTENKTYYTTYEGYTNNTTAYNEDLKVNLLYPVQKVDFTVETNHTGSGIFTVYYQGTLKIKDNNNNEKFSERVKGNNLNKSVSLDTNITSITFYDNFTTGDLASNIWIRNTKFTITPHIRLTNDSPEQHDFGTLEYGSSSAALPIKFHSFLSKGTLSVKIKGDNPTAFRVDKYINATDSLSKIGNTKHDFTIIYDPNTIGEHSAIIEISDDVNKKEIKVSGTCTKKTPTLEWNITNFQFAAGDTITNPASTNSNETIQYSSSNNSIIKIENNKLIPIGAGDVTITASVLENETTKGDSISQIFSITNKTIQYIAWTNQNFYALKIDDSDIELTAKAKDRITNQENNNPITYISADENIVKIEGNVLKIVGIGKTSITASVAESDTYAGATITKIVFVREATDDCSATYAVIDTETYSENYNAVYKTITKTFEWSDIIGETLTFTANGNIESVEAKDNTNNKSINLTAKSNTYTANINRNTRSITITITGKLCVLIWETYNISLSNIFVIPASYIEPQRDEISFSNTEINKTSHEFIDINWANHPDIIHASIINDTYGSFSIDPEFSIINASCGLSGTSPIKVLFNPKKEGVHQADLIFRVGEKTKVWDTIPLSGNGIYCETKFIYPGDWNNISNWSNGIPGAGKNTIIETDVTIPNNYTAEVNDITISNSGKIIIEPQGALKVAASLNNTTTDNLYLQANENGSAILLFRNNENNKVNATVELHSIASSDGLRNGQTGNFKDPKWQYLGIVTEEVAFSTINPNGTSNWIYHWDETQNATSCWAEKLNSGSTITAWTGYCLAQETATTYNYSGSLINSDHTYQLTYTENENSSDDLGNNLITNSYTAPIDITTISEANFTNAEANIYIYNTGSYLEWKNQTKLEGFTPGQVIVIPVNSVSALGNEYPRTIASAQAFFVKATNSGASFAINYEENVFASARKENVMRTKRLSDMSDTSDTSDTSDQSDSSNTSDWSDKTFNALKIQVTSSTSNDRLYLLEHESTTADFDNGYDAQKIFDNPNGPQIYASTPFGYTSINTNTSFDGQEIGFVANSEEEIYTITFDTKNLHSYNQLWLYDNVTEIYTDIIANESYQFYGSTTPENNRFRITSTRHDAPQGPTTAIENTTTWNDILAQNQPIYLYSITGQLIATLPPNSSFPTPNSSFPTGIYIAKSGNKTIKMIVK